MAVSELTALELADATRAGEATASPYELWKAAEREAKHDAERRELYRHAMVHAGHLVTTRQTPFKMCPMCGKRINP